MIIIASTNAQVGIRGAMARLRRGGSAVDAVETAIRSVEANADDHTVGLGGYPNLLGQVEVDAGIMDGRTLAAGAVGAVQGFKHPVSIARQVMENLPHVFLVGRGAERFAAEMGCERCELLTDEARETWAERLAQHMPAEILDQLPDLPDLRRWVEIATDPERARGTVNVLALDREHNICAGTSTSGWAWKYPGRLGDTPVIGAGLYADNRYGAAACTGMGEMAIRAGTALSLIHYLRSGKPLEAAGVQVMEELSDLGGPYLSRMNLVALDRNGNHAALSSAPGRTYIYMTDQMHEPLELERRHVQVRQQWGV